jgi:hypothetical protein
MEPQNLPAIAAIHAWDYLRIRLPTVQDEDQEAPAYTIQALPPSDQLPFGWCHCVLVHSGDDADSTQIKGKLTRILSTILKVARLPGRASAHHLQDTLPAIRSHIAQQTTGICSMVFRS